MDLSSLFQEIRCTAEQISAANWQLAKLQLRLLADKGLQELKEAEAADDNLHG